VHGKIVERMVAGLVLTMVVLGMIYAKGFGATATIILPSTTITKNQPVICSSTTATLLFSANVQRKGVAVYNGGSYAIRVSTFASTSQSIGYTVPVSGCFSDNIEAYSGAWYGISTGIGTSTVDVIEKSGAIN